MCQNLITHRHPNLEQDIEYNPQMIMIMAILMMDINTKVTSEVANLFKQYIL